MQNTLFTFVGYHEKPDYLKTQEVFVSKKAEVKHVGILWEITRSSM